VSITFIQLASDALSDIKQLGIGQSPSPEQITQALNYANRMLGKWSTQRLFLYTVAKLPFAATANVQDYTIGPSGATFTAVRPTFVEAAQVTPPGSSLYLPLSILDITKWGAIRDKGATCSASGVPQDVWIEYAYPNLGFHLWTIPSNACTIYLSAWQPLPQFVTAFDVLSFPLGYEEAIQKNLAVELSPAYDMPVDPTLAALAMDGMAKIQAVNQQSLGGALGDSQLLTAPNLANPNPTATAAPPPGSPQRQ